MPFYFFHVYDGRDFHDDEGTQLDDIHAARKQALAFTGEMMKEDRGKFWSLDSWRLEVTDANGLVLFNLIVLALATPASHKIHAVLSE